MYICLTCRRVFEDPLIVPETHFELPEHPVEKFPVCPACEEANYEEAQECVMCDTFTEESQLKAFLCPQCQKAAEARFIRLLSDNFTREELEYLNEYYDGRYFGLEKGNVK